MHKYIIVLIKKERCLLRTVEWTGNKAVVIIFNILDLFSSLANELSNVDLFKRKHPVAGSRMHVSYEGVWFQF